MYSKMTGSGSERESLEQQVSTLADSVSDLKDRVEALEDIFAPRLIDRQTKHVNSRKEDAREYLAPDDTERAVIKSPLGHGRDPDACVAKVKGIVTFIEGVGEETIETDETRAVRITRVQENCAYAVLDSDDM